MQSGSAPAEDDFSASMRAPPGSARYCQENPYCGSRRPHVSDPGTNLLDIHSAFVLKGFGIRSARKISQTTLNNIV